MLNMAECLNWKQISKDESAFGSKLECGVLKVEKV